MIVGSLPTNAGNPATAKAGCLLVLNSDGRVVETFHGHGINGPWDMTAVGGRSVSALFVTNVLNGTVAANGKTVRRGTVLRLIVTTPDPRAAEADRGHHDRLRVPASRPTPPPSSSARPGSASAGTGRCT